MFWWLPVVVVINLISGFWWFVRNGRTCWLGVPGWAADGGSTGLDLRV